MVAQVLEGGAIAEEPGFGDDHGFDQCLLFRGVLLEVGPIARRCRDLENAAAAIDGIGDDAGPHDVGVESGGLVDKRFDRWLSHGGLIP
jgi:hypothetical protein